MTLCLRDKPLSSDVLRQRGKLYKKYKGLLLRVAILGRPLEEDE